MEGRKPFGIVVVVVALLLLVGGPLLLHFGQKRHNRLDFDVAARYPADRATVGGEVYASAVLAIMEHELDGVTGWRPNDFVLWGPGLWADNNANRQRGIIQTVRESVRVFKDHLTKVSSNEYDRNLVDADTAFRNSAEKLWLPSAESKFREAVRKLKAYVDGLRATPMQSRPINQRNVELIRLFQTWGDLLGDAHGALYRDPQGVFQSDDDFYHAEGVAHVIHHLSHAVAREYEQEFAGRPTVTTLLDEVAVALGQAAVLKPLIVFNGRPDGLVANHRRNLDAYITEARQKIYSIREELEK